MTRQDFLEKAAGFYLCESTDLSLSAQLEILTVHSDMGYRKIPEQVIVWEFFEGCSLPDLVSHIGSLADSLEDTYKSGEFDGYEKIKNLIEEQYVNRKET